MPSTPIDSCRTIEIGTVLSCLMEDWVGKDPANWPAAISGRTGRCGWAQRLHTWLADTLTKLVNRWPAARIDDLMPWAYAKIPA